MKVRTLYSPAIFMVATLPFALSIAATLSLSQSASAQEPTPIIFDTDIGNDCDDVLALGMLHALESRGECKLLAVTITKDHKLAAPFADCINTFYGRGDIPIGVCDSGVTPHAGKFNILAESQTASGEDRFPHDLRSGADAAPAVEVLREQLAASEDGSVVIAQVGFSTNLANLLESKGDRFSPLSGVELVAKKVKFLSIMAGAFARVPGKDGQPYDHREYNIVKDIPAAQKLARQWPTDIVWSGFEIGISLTYPHRSIEQDFRYAAAHPLPEAYILYNPPPHDRPTWDLTSVLVGVRPDHKYFEMSSPGTVTVHDDGLTTFGEGTGGKHRYLFRDEASADRIRETLMLLSSEPPHLTK